jgi:agmatinase
MEKRPTFKLVPYFESKLTECPKSGVNILGIPYDETACFRKGAWFGPGAIRTVSDGLESYSPYLDLDLEDFNFFDLLDVENNNSWDSLEKSFIKRFEMVSLTDKKLLTLGGEHSISFLPIREYLKIYPDLLIIHLDAHADLRDGYEGYKYSHASVMFRVSELFGKNHSCLQYGIRSGTKDEFRLMKQRDSRCVSLDILLEFIEKTVRPIYLTLDLDFFDPSIMPGTGTPEAGGESFENFIKIVKRLRGKQVVGADCVELAPAIDQTGNSSVFAALVVRELILLLACEV